MKNHTLDSWERKADQTLWLRNPITDVWWQIVPSEQGYVWQRGHCSCGDEVRFASEQAFLTEQEAWEDLCKAEAEVDAYQSLKNIGRDPKAIELLTRFARNLDDVEEDPEENDWQNRLGWAWDRLADFVEYLGPDYFEAVNWNGRLQYRKETESVASGLA